MTDPTSTGTQLGRIEFVSMLAMMMATAALAIDLMLPAFAAIRESFGLPEDSTSTAQVVTAFFLGMAFAQIFWGPLADRFGRKPILYAGLAIYALGGIGAALAPTVPFLLASRAVWGAGAAAARVISQAVVRDRFKGEEMAKAFSYILTVFLVVPVVAPLIGAGLVAISSWQATAWFCVVFVVLLAAWTSRLPETLSPDNRIPLKFDRVRQSLREVVTTRLTAGTTFGMTFLFGSFASYLASSELIIGQVYRRPAAFPLVFGGTAAAMGVAAFANGRLVARFGVVRTLRSALGGFILSAGVLLLVTLASGGTPPFAVFVVLLAASLATYAMILPNANTLALLSMGHMAGTAAAVIGTISLTGGAILGALVDQAYSNTLTPLPLAMFGFGTAAILCFAWALRGGNPEASSQKGPGLFGSGWFLITRNMRGN